MVSAIPRRCRLPLPGLQRFPLRSRWAHRRLPMSSSNPARPRCYCRIRSCHKSGCSRDSRRSVSSRRNYSRESRVCMTWRFHKSKNSCFSNTYCSSSRRYRQNRYRPRKRYTDSIPIHSLQCQIETQHRSSRKMLQHGRPRQRIPTLPRQPPAGKLN